MKNLSTNIEIKKKKSFFVQYRKIIIFLSVVVGGILIYEIPLERILKRDKEIEKIISRPPKEKYNQDNACEVYSLVAKRDGKYPCYRCVGRDSILLLKGEVWKYGKTCLGENERYTEYFLYKMKVDYRKISLGTEQQCLVLEKQLIYAYPLLPECLKRNFVLLRPPGNRIDR